MFEISKKNLIVGGREITPAIRKLYDMKDVLFDKDFFNKTENIDVYYMYRDLSLSKSDYEIIKEHNLRYDITVIPPQNLGCEYTKTYGHYHPILINSDITYPEVYEVLEGKAHYLLQKISDDRITDVVLVEAEKGDKVIIPPNYGHITINPSNKILKMANWVERNFKSVYGMYSDKNGGAYFELVGGKFIKNEKYEELPEIRFVKPRSYPNYGLIKGKEMYELIRTSPEKLDFLVHPEKHIELFDCVVR